MFLVRGIILHFLDFIEFLRSEEYIYMRSKEGHLKGERRGSGVGWDSDDRKRETDKERREEK